MQTKRLFSSITLAVILILVVTTVAFAIRVTINTNDTIVDPNWAGATPVRTDGDDFADNNYDLNQVWMTSDPTNSAFFFRVNLISGGRLPADYSSFEARLDCNMNGSFTDAVDVVVYYAINAGLEELVECQGNDYPMCDMSTEPNHSDTNSALFGEEINSSGIYNYEWRADVTNGTTNWSACLGNIKVQFASLNQYQQLQDSTVWQTYNTPTAVELSQLTTTQSGVSPLAVLAGGFLAIMGLGVISTRRKA
jgi:hypothetical protein